MTLRHLVLRNRVYYFRMRVPADLRPILNKREIKRSTLTQDPWLACIRASMIATAVYRHLYQLRQGKQGVIDDYDELDRQFTSIRLPNGAELTADFNGDAEREWKQIENTLRLMQQQGLLSAEVRGGLTADSADIGIQPEPQPPTNELAETGKPISAWFDQYINEKTDPRNGNWKQATIDDYSDTKQLYLDYLLVDKPLREISVTEHTGFRKVLMKLPSNRSKKAAYKGRTVVELLQQEIPDQDLMSRSTINNHLTRLNALFNWLSKKRLTQLPALDKLNDRNGKKDSEMRDLFTLDDLHAMFSTPIFNRHRFKHSYQFWLPLLALYTGCRLRELVQLEPSDVQLDDDSEIFYLDINDNASSALKATGVVKSLKNKSSRRLVPIHPDLRRLGFLEFVDEAEKAGRPLLFDVTPDDRGDPGRQPSRWFQRYRKSIRLQPSEGKKDFHSFRHTFINALEDKDVNAELNKDLAGHAHEGTNRSTYRKAANLRKLHSALCLLNYDNVTLYIRPWGA